MSTALSTTFSTLGVPAPLVKVLSSQGIDTAFPIQVDTLPDTLNGRDVLGRGKTGSGKTLAFSIPMVSRLGGNLAGGKRRPGRPLGLILAPTRELATQITNAITPLAEAYGLNTTTIFGGVSQGRQVTALKAGVDIVVACPGRLEDLMKQGFVNLDSVEITVLDEADHMADLGFLPVVTRILDKTPGNGQRMLFSATLDNGVDKIVKRFLHDPVMHSVDEANSHVSAMTHHVFEVSGVDAKKELVQKLASGSGRRILFMRTKHQAKKLAKSLTDAGIPSVDLHGNLSQVARDRNLAAFSAGTVKVLVATDVAARGVHVDDIELVIHVDPPAEHKAYLHRSGRTARAGSTGDVVTVVLPEQKRDTDALLRKAAIKVTPQRVDAASPAVDALVGDVAAYVKPAPRVEAPQQQRQSQGGRSQGGRSQGGRSQGGRSEGGRSQGGRSEGGRDAGASRSGGGRDGARTDRNDGGRSRDSAPAGGARRERTGRPAGAATSAPRSGSAAGRSGGARVGSLQVGGLVRGPGSGGAGRSAPRRSQG
ncbi:DEAD/DEAH box helicase [Cryobacterium flavum]|uniref:DEAD/DEAH box helicase n=1 Tax=Cryobacterium flavum TaxID=1424659 RepID=A0ABY2HWD9_9MICO|nr:MULTISPECIES: DEAD/DEAH box helicase [Cryobacterium]TFB72024.1 DEAD/DEAH box helicase [Cryobacterium flavum]